MTVPPFNLIEFSIYQFHFFLHLNLFLFYLRMLMSGGLLRSSVASLSVCLSFIYHGKTFEFCSSVCPSVSPSVCSRW